MSDCTLHLKMTDLKAMVAAEVERCVASKLQELGSVLASDMTAMFRNVSDEMERLGRRIKDMEELLHDKKLMQGKTQTSVKIDPGVAKPATKTQHEGTELHVVNCPDG